MTVRNRVRYGGYPTIAGGEEAVVGRWLGSTDKPAPGQAAHNLRFLESKGAPP